MLRGILETLNCSISTITSAITSWSMSRCKKKKNRKCRPLHAPDMGNIIQVHTQYTRHDLLFRARSNLHGDIYVERVETKVIKAVYCNLWHRSPSARFTAKPTDSTTGMKG